MKYCTVNGPVYCRHAKTGPILNSPLALEYGVRAALPVRPQWGIQLEQGDNVKLRLVLADRSLRLTCHGKVDWVEIGDEPGECRVGFGSLSLGDEEFQALLANQAEDAAPPLEYGDSVRRYGTEAQPLVVGKKRGHLRRDKAVSMPVSLIEQIDEARGTTPFSEYVVDILSRHLGEP
jgi:hypothetical protein